MIKDLDVNSFGHLSGYDGHERLIYFSDPSAGLSGFIAIHNTNLGQATGGTRLKFYESEANAISDAFNLSRAMTYKCALAGVRYGGGKSVILYNGRKDRELLKSYAMVINHLGGEFTTGKDVGIGDSELAEMSEESPYISHRIGRQDPSIYASAGVYIAMKSAAGKIYGDESLMGRTIAVKGLGQVGYELARLIYEDGGNLIVADIDSHKTDMARRDFVGAVVASPDRIHEMPCDIYSPCALGAEFSPDSVGKLNCKIICGAANNQLTSPLAGVKIKDRGMVYVPDYVANAGGLIAVVDGHSHKDFEHDRIMSALAIIGKNVGRIVDLSLESDKSTDEVADRLAESIFKKLV